MKSEKVQSATPAYFAIFLCHGLGAAVLGPTLIALAEQTDSALDQISILFLTGSLGFLVGAHLCSRLFDRFRGHRLLATALGIGAFCYLLFPLTPSLWLLATLKFVAGVGASTMDTGTNTLLIWRHGKKVAPYMNALHSCFGVGAFISPIIIAHVVSATGGIRWAYWILGSIMAIVAIWLTLIPSPVIPEHASEKTEKGKLPRGVWFVAVFFFLYVGAEIAFGGWIYTYGLKLKLADVKTAAYLTSLFWGTFTLGRLISIPIATRIRPRFVLAGDLVGALLGLSIILFGRSSTAALWVGTGLFGLSMASIFPTMMAVAERRMAITGRITGWFFVGASAGAMCLPTLIGQFFETIGPRIAMMAILISMLAAIVVAGMMRASKTRRSTP